MSIYDVMNDVTKIFNMNSIAKDINSLSVPHPVSGIYILQE